MQLYDDKKITIISWVFAIALLIASLTVYDIIYRSNKGLEQELKESFSSNIKLKRLIKNRDTIESNYLAVAAKQEQIDGDILKFIASEVKKSSLKLVDIRKDEQVATDREYINLRMTGTLDQLIALAYSLADSSALINIDSYEISKENESLLQIILVLERHVL